MATVAGLVTTSSTSNASTYATSAATPTAGALLVAFVSASGTVAVASFSSSAGLTFTRVNQTTWNSSADTLYCFVANSAASATSQTFTFNCTGDAATGAAIHVMQITGMSLFGSSAVLQHEIQANQPSGTPSVSFASSALTGNPTVGAVGNSLNPAGLTAPTNWTQRVNTGYNTPATGLHAVSRDSGFTGTAITWGSSTSTTWAAFIVELDATVPITVTEAGGHGIEEGRAGSQQGLCGIEQGMVA